MASNAFDQFDAPEAQASGNAFDQFDPAKDEIQTLPTVQAEAPDPTEGMSGLEKFLAGVGKSFSDTGRGLYQAGVDSAARTVNPVGALLRNVGATGLSDAVAEYAGAPLSQESVRLQAEEKDSRRIDAPLMSTGAGISGNVAGTLAQIFAPGVALRGTAAGAALLPRTVAGNALQGGALGAVQPNTGQVDVATNAALGGVVGGAAATLPKILSAGRRGLSALLPGSTAAAERAAASAVTDSGAEAATASPNTLSAGARLRAALLPENPTSAERAALEVIRREAANPDALVIRQSVVPGVQRTLGESTLDPGVMALENTIRSQQRAVFEPIDRANNLARVAQIERIAGSEADMLAAQQARSAASSTAREQAMRGGSVDLSQTLAAIRQAVASQQGRKAVQGGLREAESLLTNDAAKTAGPGGQMEVVDNVRMSLGDMLNGTYAADTPKALVGSRELIGVRNTLNNEVSNQIPAFGQYLDAYRQGSVPINRMELGRTLLDKSSSAIPDEMGVRTLLPAMFSRQMNDLDATAARATGFPKARAEEILSKSDLDSLRNIQDDLSRQFRRQGSATTGSQTAERVGIMSRIGERSGDGIAGMLPGAVGNLAKDAAKGVKKGIDERLQQKLAYLIANPAEYERLAAKLSATDKRALDTAIGQVTARAGVSAVPNITE